MSSRSLSACEPRAARAFCFLVVSATLCEMAGSSSLIGTALAACSLGEVRVRVRVRVNLTFVRVRVACSLG